MKIDEIRVGTAYSINPAARSGINGSIGVVIDIGRFDALSDGGPRRATRIMEWNGGTYKFRNWYMTSSTASQRRVALVTLSSESVGDLVVLPASQLMFAPPEELIKDDISRDLARRTVDKHRDKLTEKIANSKSQIREVVRILTPDVAEDSRSHPFGRLLDSDVLPKMILLYLEYHRMKEQPINGYDNVEALAETLRDSLVTLKSTFNPTDVNYDVCLTAARSYVDSAWSATNAPVVKEISEQEAT